ncbi:ATP-binding protein [Candidatus Spongiisocius sp.]|uniref:ATP-binding protein n=1 Tax=Candidatus Spongiisocius sp. TaxID=3101273 RepID=UPI003B5A4FBE
MAHNPFTPTFGAPPLVVGDRDRLVDEIGTALETGPRHPAYTTLATGDRGMGKTVLLNEIEDMAHRKGWRVLGATATDGRFMDELAEGGLILLQELRPDPDSMTGGHAQMLGIGGGMERVAASRRDESVRNSAFRAIVGELANHFSGTGAGLLITVDELHSADIAETRRFGAVIQKITRRAQQPVAFVGAGLPRLLTDLMSGDAATFLQRCRRLDVGLAGHHRHQAGTGRHLSPWRITHCRQSLARRGGRKSGVPVHDSTGRIRDMERGPGPEPRHQRF